MAKELKSKLTINTRNFTAGIEKAKKSVKGFSRAAVSQVKRVGKAFTSLRLLVGAVFVRQLAKSSSGFAAYADRVTLLDARLRNATKTTQEFTTAQSRLNKISNSTGQDLFSLAEIFTKISQSTDQSSERILKFTETLATGFRAFGVEAQQASSVILQLSQGLGSNNLADEELKSLRENASGLFNSLEDVIQAQLGTTTSLKELGSQGRLTTDVILSGFEGINQQVLDLNKNIPTTFSQISNTIKTSLVDAIRQIDFSPVKKDVEGIAAVFRSDSFATGVRVLVDGLIGLVSILTKAVNGLGKLVTLVNDARRGGPDTVDGVTAAIEKQQAVVDKLKASVSGGLLGSIFNSKGLETQTRKLEVLKTRLAELKSFEKITIPIDTSGPGTPTPSPETPAEPVQADQLDPIISDVEQQRLDLMRLQNEQAKLQVEEANKLADSLKPVTEQLIIQFNEQLKTLEAMEEGEEKQAAITALQREFTEELRKAQEETDILLKLQSNLLELGKQATVELATAIVDSFAEGKKSFQDFASEFLRRIAIMIVQSLILLAIQKALGATGGAVGNIASTVGSAAGSKAAAKKNAEEQQKAANKAASDSRRSFFAQQNNTNSSGSLFTGAANNIINGISSKGSQPFSTDLDVAINITLNNNGTPLDITNVDAGEFNRRVEVAVINASQTNSTAGKIINAGAK